MAPVMPATQNHALPFGPAHDCHKMRSLLKKPAVIKRQTSQCRAANHERPECKPQFGAEPAHAIQILLMHCMDNHSCSQEEQRLKESMRHEMEHGR